MKLPRRSTRTNAWIATRSPAIGRAWMSRGLTDRAWRIATGRLGQTGRGSRVSAHDGRTGRHGRTNRSPWLAGAAVAVAMLGACSDDDNTPSNDPGGGEIEDSPRASLAVVRRSSIRMFRSATSATQRKHRSIPPSRNLRRPDSATLRITARLRVASPIPTRALGCRWRRNGQVGNARKAVGMRDVELSGSTGALCRMRRQAPGQSVCLGHSAFEHCDPPAQVGKRCRLRPGWRIRPTSAEHDPAVRTRANLDPISRVYYLHAGYTARTAVQSVAACSASRPPRRAASTNGCRTTWSENLAELDFVTAVAPRDQFDHGRPRRRRPRGMLIRRTLPSQAERGPSGPRRRFAFRHRRVFERHFPPGVGAPRLANLVCRRGGRRRSNFGAFTLVVGLVVGIGLVTLAMVIAIVGRDFGSGGPDGRTD